MESLSAFIIRVGSGIAAVAFSVAGSAGRTLPAELATWWLQETPGVNYWRAEIPARHLPGQCLALAYSDLQADPDGEPFMPRQQGAAVWMFEATAGRGVLMAHLQEQGVRVLLEADDNYTVMHEGLTSQAGHWTQRPHGKLDYPSIDAHRQIASFVDGIIVSTPYLEREYRKVSDADIFVCPNSVDPADWPTPKPTDNSSVFRVGFAGSISHWDDVHLIRRALLWASKQDGVEVCYFGQMPAGFEFVQRHVPWTDSVEQYRTNVTALDVGLAPLVETRWSKGKSDVKCLEYSMAGALTICQDAEPFKAFKGPCVRVDSAKGFERAVRWAVLHQDEARDMAREARKYVLRERSIEANIWKWHAAIGEE